MSKHTEDAALMTATEAMTAGDGESDHDELVKALRKAIDACHKSEIKQIKAERDEAVNNHDELVEALKIVIGHLEEGESVEPWGKIHDKLNDVLSKIDGEPQTLLENRSWVVASKEETS